MSNIPLLNFFGIAVSVYNVVLMLWLGLTVLLNAERRVWGVWLAGGSLILGSIFFVSHTIILQRGLDYPDWQFAFWWKAGILPAQLLPYAWYIVMLWYAGYWNDTHNELRRRQRWPLRLVTAGMLFGLAILLVYPTAAIPFYYGGNLEFFTPLSTYYKPIIGTLGAGFAGYIILCLMLSLDAVRRPGPTWRMMGDAARKRAGPWLVGTSIVQLMVSFMVTAAIAWVLYSLIDGFEFFLLRRTWNILAAFDLAIAGLLLLTVMMLGQATIAYELFTGRSMPRRGMQSQWRIVLILGGLFSLIVAAVEAVNLPAMHTMLLMTILIISISAIIGQLVWRTRQQTLTELRPFISSQRLYDNLLDEVESGEVTDLQPAFNALCRDLLGASVGYLLPLGPLATLVNGPLAFPAGREVPNRLGVVNRFSSPEDEPLAVEPSTYADAAWAIPLWSRHGLIGLFLLGNKWDGGLYAEEDIAAARTAGERLIDTMASAEITRRLIMLQRQKLVESQLLDQKTRRVLHDEVLPILHTTMLSLNGPNGNPEAIQELTTAHQMIADLLAQMPGASIDPVERLGLTKALKKLANDEMANQFNGATFDFPADVEHELNHLPAQTAEIVYYAAREALRNSAKHGRGSNKNRPLNIAISGQQSADGLQLIVQDDGVGVGHSTQKLNPNGAGQGLTLHSTMLAVMGGQLRVESEEDEGTQVVIEV